MTTKQTTTTNQYVVLHVLDSEILCDHINAIGVSLVVLDLVTALSLWQTRRRNTCLAMTAHTDLLRGIEVLPTVGVPGRVIVHGATASAVLTANNPADVLIAAAEVGTGRVLVIAHDGYMVDFAAGAATDLSIAQLHRNIRRWATGEDGVVEGDVCVLNDVDRFVVERGRCQIAVWYGGAFEGADAVAEYVISGGVLVHAICPWGWLQLNPGKTLLDMPLVGILRLAGVSYSPEYSAAGDSGYPVDRSQASDAHLGQLIHRCLDNPQTLSAHGATLCECLCRLPPDVQGDLKPTVAALYDRHRADIEQLAPSPQKPLYTEKDKALSAVCDWMARRNIGCAKMPGIGKFPGDFDHCPPTMHVEMEIESRVQDYHATGYYLPAGQSLVVTTVTPLDVKGTWSVSVGCHRDTLEHSQSSQRRWPNVVVTRAIIQQRTTVMSPYGGLVYLESPDDGGIIRFELDNVVEAPYFDLTDPASVADWDRRRLTPGLWTDVSGEHVTITLPASSVRHLDDPSVAMATWDRVVTSYHDLRGTDPRRERRTWVVADEQPSVGYMHSGCPIVTHLDVADPTSADFLLDAHALTTRGTWGVFHEIGHNMQREDWTFRGTREVTCNVFTLYAMHIIANRDPWIHEWLSNQLDNIRKYLRSGAPFEACWELDPGVALGMYAQLAHHFGWRCYKKVFREYEISRDPDNASSEDDKRMEWVRRFSGAARYNLCPLVRFWGFPLTGSIEKDLSHLQPFLPDDEMTILAPERTRSIVAQYENIVRVADAPVDVCSDFPDRVTPNTRRQPSRRVLGARLN